MTLKYLVNLVYVNSQKTGVPSKETNLLIKTFQLYDLLRDVYLYKGIPRNVLVRI